MAKLDRLLARINEVLERGTFASASEWCREAGVSRSYIGALRNRGGTKGTGEVRNVKHEEIAKLAGAARVEVGWLMGEDTLPSNEAPDGLERALMQFDWPDTLTAAQAKEVQRLARAEAADAGANDLPPKFWLARLARIAADVRHGATSSRVQASRKAR